MPRLPSAGGQNWLHYKTCVAGSKAVSEFGDEMGTLVSAGQSAKSQTQMSKRMWVLTPYTKINSKCIKDLNLRPETIKLLEENIGKTLSNIHHSRILYDPPPRILEIKAKINKWDLINLKSFCTSKETIIQRRHTDG